MHLGLVVPQSGPSGIFGPSCASSAQLAVEEINAHDGILGEEVSITTIDGGAPPVAVADAVSGQFDIAPLDALVGWHTSAVRRRLVTTVRGRIPYVYTAVYEGGETAASTFMTGEVPDDQLLPALTWMSEELGITRWAVVGSDYVWPRRTAAAVTAHLIAHAAAAQVVSTTFVPLGTTDFDDVLRQIEITETTGVLLLLLGGDAVVFNRAFGAAGLHDRCTRLSPLMDENILLGSGYAATRELYSVSGYFESLATAASQDFEQRYVARFGPLAPPLTSAGESCYEGLLLLAELAQRAGTLDAGAVDRVAAQPFRYTSPRGEVVFDRGHVRQDIYLAAADGFEFDILTRVSSVETCGR